MYIIYGLEDPRDHKIFYVGQTQNAYRRFRDHLKCNGGNYKNSARVVEMREQDIIPHFVELERTEDSGYARVREVYWIQHYISLGHLMNNEVHSEIKFIGKVLVRSNGVRSPKEAIKAAEQSLVEQKVIEPVVPDDQPVTETILEQPCERPDLGKQDLMMTDLQLIQFEVLYKALGNIKDSLRMIEGCNNRHHKHASWVVRQKNLRGN